MVKFVPKPLPSHLVLDKYDQERWDACRQVAYLRQAAAQFPNRNVLVRAAQRREIQSMFAFRGVPVPERSIETIDLPARSLRGQLPPQVARYVQVMARAVDEVRTAPVGYVLKRVVQALAAPPQWSGRRRGLPEEPVTSDLFPWRTTPHRFGESAGHRGAAPVPPGPKLRDEAERLFEWMDTPNELTPLNALSLGAFKLCRLAPFENTLDVVPIYITLGLIRSDNLEAQILPMAVHLDQNRVRFEQVQLEAEETGDFNNLVKFFADGLVEQAGNQLRLIQDLAKLPEEYDKTYREAADVQDRRDGFPHMLTILPRFQVVTSKLIADECGFSAKSAREYLLKAEELHFVEHVDTYRQTKIYEVTKVQRAIDLYGGKARHRGRLDVAPGSKA